MHIKIKNRVCKHSGNLIKLGKVGTNNIFIDDKNFKDLVVHFTRYVNRKPIKMLSLLFYKLIRKIEESEGKKYLMVDDYMVRGVFYKIKKR